MSEGRIYYANKQGNYYLKLVDDVRVTLCSALSNYVKGIFALDQLNSVVVDLRDATAVDSTTLGLLAKIALYAQNKKHIKPLLIVSDNCLIRLVYSMGFDEIFAIADTMPETVEGLEQMQCCGATTEDAREQVIDSHKVLMSMNKKNLNAFAELVSCLEQEAQAT